MSDRIEIPSNCDIFDIQTDRKAMSDKELKEVISPLADMSGCLLVINDTHRSTPSRRLIKLLVPILDISEIIIATGTHPTPKNDEIKQLVGRCDIPIQTHNCDEEMQFYGTTSRGTPILLNAILTRFQKILTINSVEPHFFAGFTGGVKSIVPGLASRETIVQNHSWAMDDRANPGVIEGNPLQEDLQEGFQMFVQGKEVRTIQMVSDGEEIYFTAIGPLMTAFHETVAIASSMFIRKTQLYDVIVSFVQQPLNRSLYQAQKGIENTRRVLKKGGCMVLVADCYEGIGNDAFYNTIKLYSNKEDIIRELDKEHYKFGDHKAYKLATMSLESDLYIVSQLPIKVVREVFAESMSITTLEESLQRWSRQRKSIALVLHAGMITLIPIA